MNSLTTTSTSELGQPMGAPQGPPPPQANSTADMIQDWMRMIRRQWKTLTRAALAALAVALLYLLLTPFTYNATVTLLLDARRIDVFQQPTLAKVQLETNTAIESQLEVLKSDGVSRRVIKKLALDKDPEFDPPPPGRRGILALLLQRAGPVNADDYDEQFRIGQLQDDMIVKRLGATYAVELTYKAKTAKRAAEIANAIAQAYIDYLEEQEQGATKRASGWMQERLKDVRTAASDSQMAVANYKATTGIVDIDGKPILERQLAEYSTQLLVAQGQVVDAQSKLDRIQAAKRNYAASPSKPVLPDFLTDPLTTKLREQYFELSNREADWSQRYGANHKATEKLRKQLDDIRASFKEDFNRLEDTAKNDVMAAKKREDSIRRALDAAVKLGREQDKAAVRLKDLQSAALAQGTLYDGLLKRQTEAAEQEVMPISGARMISHAAQPLTKSYKKPLIISAALLLGTFGLGCLLALLREAKDRSFRTSRDLETHVDTRFISMVPLMGETQPTRLARRPAIDASGAKPRTLVQANRPLWAYSRAPDSQFAEAIRSINLTIGYANVDNSCQIVGIVSALPSEGASTVASSVAQAFAMARKRVLLVDCDLRHPSLTRNMTPSTGLGIVDVLTGTATIEDAIWTDPQSGMHFLPGVHSGHLMCPDEVMASNRMRKLFADLRANYDYVIVDLPPIVPMEDVRISANFIDAFIGVVAWGESEKDTVTQAFMRTDGLRQTLLGAVLNKVDLEQLQLFNEPLANSYDRKRYANYNQHTIEGHGIQLQAVNT